MNIQGIIFDLDGTLLDTETLSDYAMFAALNIPPPPQPTDDDGDSDDDNKGRLPWELKRQILGLRSSDWGPIVLQYAETKWGIPKDTLPSIEVLAMNWERQLNEYCADVTACTGAYQLVGQFARLGIPMSIATSSCQSAVDKKRKNHMVGLFEHIPIIVCGDHPAVKQGKPAPDIYLEAARQMNLLPQQCLVFEDAMNGIHSAKAAGCGCVVAIPDQRYNSINPNNNPNNNNNHANEMQMFHDIADMVIPDILHFNGTPFGWDIDMVKRYKLNNSITSHSP